MTIGKTIALSKWIFVGKVMSLLFNMLSRLVITFLPRSKHLLISRLQSLSPVILEPKKRKFTTASTFSPSISHEVMGLDAMILVCLFVCLFLIFSFKPVFSFSSFLQSFPASGFFPMSQFFASGDQSIRVSASASVLPMNIQD